MAEASQVENKRFKGNFLLFRRNKHGLQRKYAGSPRFRHQTREAAETEAARLLELFPESSFVVIQEVGVLKRAAPAVAETGNAL